jgi:anti-sigma factor ChrR (cupin superfamily)
VYQSPGHTVPWHRHRGRETVLVIDGYGVESGGENLSPGSMVHSDETVVHQLVFEAGEPCCYAVRLDGALEYLDAPTPSGEEQP